MDKTGRLPRTHIPNTIHHVMVRGNNRANIFYNAIYFEHYLNLIAESAKKFDHKILCYCLMTNHAHLLIHIHSDSLSAIMQNINNRYAKWFNIKHNRIGHLFQGRYRSIAVNDESYLVNLCRYIHLNPVAAKMVSYPGDYPWSSHHYYLCKKTPEWMQIELVQRAIKQKANLTYQNFINEPIDRTLWKPGLFMSETGQLVINEDVVRDLHPHLNKTSDTQSKKKTLPAKMITQIVCSTLNLEFEQFIEKSLSRKISQGRAILVNAWLNYSDLNKTEIAKCLNRTRGTLSRQMQRLDKTDMTYFSAIQLRNIEKDLENELSSI